MEHLSNYHKDSPSQHENSHKLCDKTGHPIFCLTESEVKPVENISKNQQSFLEISRLQKKVLPSHKLQDHAYE